MDLPHASYLCSSQIPVSVIISCKTVKTGSVENTVGTLFYQCVLLPLGSPWTGQKRVSDMVHPSAGCTDVGGTGGYQGGLYRWVLGRAIPGTTQPLLEERS